MARERMVTRTIEVLEAQVICLDVNTVETTIRTLELTGVGKVSNEKILSILKKNYETDTFKVVAIQSTNVREELYGLKELDFLKYAHRLDATTRKMLEENDNTIEESTVDETAESTDDSITPVISTPKPNKKNHK